MSTKSASERRIQSHLNTLILTCRRTAQRFRDLVHVRNDSLDTVSLAFDLGDKSRHSGKGGKDESATALLTGVKELKGTQDSLVSLEETNEKAVSTLASRAFLIGSDSLDTHIKLVIDIATDIDGSHDGYR